MTKFKGLIMFCAFSLFQICCNSPTRPGDFRIYGSWNLINTWNGEQCTNVLINYDKNGVFSFYRNDSILDFRSFVIEYGTFSGPISETTNDVYFVNYDGYREEYYDCAAVDGHYEIINDTLVIWHPSGTGSGLASLYARAK
jgi:hypothetical protein